MSMNDPISRQAVVDLLDEYMGRLCIHIGTLDDTESYSYARGLLVGVINNIKHLPPAQPKIKCIAKVTLTDEQVKEAFEKAKCEILAAQPEQRWIPCTPDTMPEEGERVLATHLGGLNPNRQVIEHIYQCGKFTCGWDMDMNVDSPTFGQRYMGEVIAWMPLPEPWREEN